MKTLKNYECEREKYQIRISRWNQRRMDYAGSETFPKTNTQTLKSPPKSFAVYDDISNTCRFPAHNFIVCRICRIVCHRRRHRRRCVYVFNLFIETIIAVVPSPPQPHDDECVALTLVLTRGRELECDRGIRTVFKPS